MTSPYQVAGSFRGKFTTRDVEDIIGPPSEGWVPWEPDENVPLLCGLAPGRILNGLFRAGDGFCRIYIHSDGVCVIPCLNVDIDKGVAAAISKVLAVKIGGLT